MSISNQEEGIEKILCFPETSTTEKSKNLKFLGLRPSVWCVNSVGKNGEVCVRRFKEKKK